VSEIEVRPAAPADWDALTLVLGGDDDRGCWCQAWRGVEVTGEPRRDALRRQLATFDPPPGYLAWIGAEAVGWVGVGVRTRTPRLARSRTIPAVDDLPVWSIGCFRIRPGYRRRGVASALLDGVIAAAREARAPGVEAYPIDPGGRRVDPGFAFVGLASMFDRAGFRRVLETGAHSAGLPRLLVRLDLPG
jgi:GNAT superfamily N-acetyltransferase